MNPYWGCGFFEFFKILFSRGFAFLSGAQLELASDEVQLGTLALVALSCGLLGPFLILKRMAMFANSLSHTILFGIVLAFLFASKLWGGEMFSLTTLLIGSLAAAGLTAVLTLGLNRFFRLSEDASVGLVFSSLFALGILLVTLFTRDVHLGLEAIMGNVDALQNSDFQLAALLAGLNCFVLFIFYRQFKISAFDPEHASILGIPSSLFRFLLLLLSSFVSVGAFRAVGVLLVLGFLTGPYLTARLFSSNLKHLLWLSPALGILASAIGVALSRSILSVYDLPLSTAGIVISLVGIFYGIGVNLSSVINYYHAKSQKEDLSTR
jgi:manganese/zinc/iron transport system permease protein